MDKIFKQLYPGVKEEYLERAFEKLKKNGCPADVNTAPREPTARQNRATLTPI